MKIHGEVLEGPALEVVVIPRQAGNIVFKARAVLDYEPFHKLCPVPEPPTIKKRGGEEFKDIKDTKYVDAITTWAEKKTHWMVLQSLLATEGLEFENIKDSDSDTWSNYDEEFHKAGFTEGEISKIVGIVISVNGLDQTKIDEATKRFLSEEAPTVSE